VKHRVVADPKTGNKNFAKFWYPTVLLNIDMKKALPEEGVEFLFVRTQAKRIQNGRLDLEVTIWDETGDVVALSHHVCLVLSASRNTAERKRDPPAEGSKL
jgi:acyl-CoA thioesterase FadM